MPHSPNDHRPTSTIAETIQDFFADRQIEVTGEYSDEDLENISYELAEKIDDEIRRSGHCPLCGK